MTRAFRPDGDAPVVALSAVDLTIEEGAFVALLGPSGCGKSTLLRLVAGLDRPDTGEIQVPALAAQEIGFVFQDAHLLPWRTVEENVALPLQLRGVAPSEHSSRVRAALREVDLETSARRYPAELSGGMRMRASIARALVTRPRLLLMDEPFAALDEITRHRLDERLHELWREQHLTLLFVTHTIFEATFLAQRALVMGRRPGRILRDVTLALPERRESSLRGTPEFMHQAQQLLEGLEEASA